MEIRKITLAVLMIAGITVSCRDKENGSEDISTEAALESRSSTTSDANRSDTGNSTESADDVSRNPQGSGGSGSGSGNTTSADFSGDGSDGRTQSTSVNRSRKTQTATAGKRATGYSAPDGTPAENNDGDMYTKHDTTRMPSGPPIK